jgi:glutamate-1-semialdehyde 2,1-aminomutase
MVARATGQEAAVAQATPKTDDVEFFARELEAFVPDRVFDAHMHLWRDDFATFNIPGLSGDVGMSEYQALMQDLHPKRQLEALAIPFTSAAKPEGRMPGNEWVAAELKGYPASRGLFFVTPQDDAEWVRTETKRLGLHGLKCYHTFATDVSPTWDAEIPDYLPEPLVRVCGEEGWSITLHIVRARALGDPSNIHWIRHYCTTYPDMNLILDHSGRGFQPAHNLEGLLQLTGLPNLYFDTSANCEPIAHQSILRIIGPERLMYGSDLPASHERGRSLAVSDTFLWLSGDNPAWEASHQTINPMLVGLEHLRSLKWACWAERLTDKQEEDVFWNNAARLFAL